VSLVKRLSVEGWVGKCQRNLRAAAEVSVTRIHGVREVMWFTLGSHSETERTLWGGSHGGAYCEQHL